jgi:hypothetical protein
MTDVVTKYGFVWFADATGARKTDDAISQEAQALVEAGYQRYAITASFLIFILEIENQ